MHRLSFQFTLRQLLLSMVWFSMAFAFVTLVFRSSTWLLTNFPMGMLLLVPFIPSVLGALCGAGIGTLRHRTTEFACEGFFWLPILCLAVPAALILFVVILAAIFSLTQI